MYRDDGLIKMLLSLLICVGILVFGTASCQYYAQEKGTVENIRFILNREK